MKKLILFFLFAFSINAFGTNFIFQNTSVALSNNLPGALCTYTFTQTTSAIPGDQINAARTFAIIFPPGTDLGFCHSGTYNGTPINWVVVTRIANRIYFQTPIAISSNSTFDIILNDVINSSLCGTITDSVPNVTGDTTSGSYYAALAGCINFVPNEIVLEKEITVYPSPTKNNFTISFSEFVHEPSVMIFNNLGEKVFEKNISGVVKEIPVHFSAAAGIYFLKVKEGKRERVMKIAVSD